MNGQDKRSGKAQASGSNVNVPKKNRFYALRCKGEQESSPDVVTGMLQVFCIDIYSLLELGATHFFPHIIQVGFLLGDLVTLPF